MAVQLNIPSIFNELEVLRIPQPGAELTRLQNEVRDLLADHNMEIVDPNEVYNKLPQLDFEQFSDILMNDPFFRASVLFRFRSNLEYRVNNFGRNPYLVHGFNPTDTITFHKYQYWMRYLIVCGRQNDFWVAYNQIEEIFITPAQQYRFRMYCHPDFNSMNIFEMVVLWIDDEDFIIRLTDEDYVPDYEFLDRCRNSGFSQRIYHNPFYLLFSPLNCGNGPFFTTENGRIMLRNYNTLPGMLRDWDEFLNQYYDEIDNGNEHGDNVAVLQSSPNNDNGENNNDNEVNNNDNEESDDEEYIEYTDDEDDPDAMEQAILNNVLEQINAIQNSNENSNLNPNPGPNPNSDEDYYSDASTEDEPDSCG